MRQPVLLPTRLLADVGVKDENRLRGCLPAAVSADDNQLIRYQLLSRPLLPSFLLAPTVNRSCDATATALTHV